MERPNRERANDLHQTQIEKSEPREKRESGEADRRTHSLFPDQTIESSVGRPRNLRASAAANS